MDRLSDSLPVVTNPLIIVKDMYVIIIYNSLSPDTFAGQAVFADIGPDFAVDAFQMSHISLDSFVGIPSASISLPRSILTAVGLTGDHRVVFNFFLTDGLFVRRDSFIRANGLENEALGGLGVAAHIAGGVSVNDLEEPIDMTFTVNPVSCTFIPHSLISPLSLTHSLTLSPLSILLAEIQNE